MFVYEIHNIAYICVTLCAKPVFNLHVSQRCTIFSKLPSLSLLFACTTAMDSDLSATRESLEVLKNHHEALQRSSTKTIAELQKKLQLAEEEAARSKITLSLEKHKVSVIQDTSLLRHCLRPNYNSIRLYTNPWTSKLRAPLCKGQIPGPNGVCYEEIGSHCMCAQLHSCDHAI